MNRMDKIEFSDLFLIPNLLSLLRLLLLVPLILVMREESPENILLAGFIVIVAGISDFADGFLARKLNQRSRLGLYLDPVIDKIMTLTLIVLLLLTRDFPLWLALMILLRDLAILSGSKIYNLTEKQVPPSQLPGKYYFSSVSVLLGSYVINFQFGIIMMLAIMPIFYIWSSINYIKVLINFRKGKKVEQFKDNPILKLTRIILTNFLSAVFLYRLYYDVVIFYFN